MTTKRSNSSGEHPTAKRKRSSTTLLEELRSPGQLDPTQRVQTILEHRSEFPFKLRAAIRNATPGRVSNDPCRMDFLPYICDAIAAFFLGRPIPPFETTSAGDQQQRRQQQQLFQRRQRRPNLSFLRGIWQLPKATSWHGPDSDVDTEDELEVAIRFYPDVLKGHSPIYAMLRSTKAMGFIPLLAELGTELNSPIRKEGVGVLRMSPENIFLQLMYNSELMEGHRDKEFPKKIDDISTAIMVRLKDKNLMKKEDIRNFDLLTRLLRQLYRRDPTRNHCFESRLRFLIDWDPSILENCRGGFYCADPLLHWYLHDEYALTRREHLKRFRTIFELGMIYYPYELGFLFDGQAYRMACHAFGAESVEQIIDEALASFNDPIVLRELVVTAASNGAVSLEGVYVLLRRNPIVMVPTSSG